MDLLIAPVIADLKGTIWHSLRKDERELTKLRGQPCISMMIITWIHVD